MRARFVIIDLDAECRDCDWHSGDYLKGKEKARTHAMKHDHRVTVEIGCHGMYTGNRYTKGTKK